MLYLKCKTEYLETNSESSFIPGDIVKYSANMKPHNHGTCYFVISFETPVLTLRNLSTMNVVKYNVAEQKFHF